MKIHRKIKKAGFALAAVMLTLSNLSSSLAFAMESVPSTEMVSEFNEEQGENSTWDEEPARSESETALSGEESDQGTAVPDTENDSVTGSNEEESRELLPGQPDAAEDQDSREIPVSDPDDTARYTEETENSGSAEDIPEEPSWPLWDQEMTADLKKGNIIIKDAPDREGFLLDHSGEVFYVSPEMKIRISGEGKHDVFVTTGQEVYLVFLPDMDGGIFSAEGNGRCKVRLQFPEEMAAPDRENAKICFDEIRIAGDMFLTISTDDDMPAVSADRISCSGNALINAPEGMLIVKEEEEVTENLYEEETGSLIGEETESLIEEETESFSEEETENLSEEETKEADPETERGPLELSVSLAAPMLKATAGTKEYGKDPFDQEYSSGAIIRVDESSTRTNGLTGPVIMTNVNTGVNTQIYIGKNTAKSANVYKDFYGGAVMGQERYDVRIYSWGKDDDGQGYAVLPAGYGALGSPSNTYSNGVSYKRSPTKVWLEYHFYKEGTLKTSSPQEVSFKGTIRYNDIDNKEGYAFIQGFGGAWTDANSTIVRTTGSDGLTWYMGTESSQVGLTQEAQTIWVQVNSSPSVPYTVIYDAYTSYGSGASASTVSITYKLTDNSAKPSAYKLPPGESYYAKYGSYKVENTTQIKGYTFRGWNTSQNFNGTAYKGGETIVTASNVTLWGEYVLNTADITVEKQVSVPDNSGYSEAVKRPFNGEGIALRLVGTGDAGVRTEMYALIGSDGKAVFKNVPLSEGRNYTITEVDRDVVNAAAAAGNVSARALLGASILPLSWFLPSAPQTTALPSSGASVKLENTMRRWKLKVWKTDRKSKKKKEPSGDASLEGAVYTLYDGAEEIASYTTDADGAFETDAFLPGDQWTIKETVSSEGYLIDPTVYRIAADGKDLTGSDETALVSLKDTGDQLTDIVTEKVMERRVRIKKELGTEDDHTPLQGAGFSVYEAKALAAALGAGTKTPEETIDHILKNLLSEDRTSYTGLDKITPFCEPFFTDENGEAESGLLPYGEYILVETKVPAGALCAEPIAFEVREDSADEVTEGDGGGIGDLYFEIYDEPIKVRPLISKKDAATGKDVTASGMTFVIHDTEGAFAKQAEKIMGSSKWKAYRDKYGDLIVADDGTGSREHPYVTENGKDVSYAFALPGIDLPGGTYALEEIKAPGGFVCHGYEGTYRTKENETFAEAKDMTDPKWDNSIFAGDTDKTGMWAPKFEEKELPALMPFKIDPAAAVYDSERKVFISRFTFEDERAKGKISVFVQKELLKEFRSSGDNNAFVYESVPVKGAVFEVRSAEEIRLSGTEGDDRILFDKGDLVLTLVSDENGEARSEGVTASDQTVLSGLPMGRYEITMTGPEELIREDNAGPKTFEIGYRDDRTPILYEDVLYKIPAMRYELYGLKKDVKTDAFVPGAVLGLYSAEVLTDEEGTEKVAKDTLLSVLTTKGQSAAFPGTLICDELEESGPFLPKGEYYVKEIEPPAGYYPNDDIFNVSMPSMDRETVQYRDVPIEAKFFLKDDLTFNELADAQFVVRDQEGNEVDSFITTDTNGKGRLLRNLKSGGVYTLEERIPREGYHNTILDEKGEPAGEENRYTFTVPAEQEPFTITLYNAFVTGSIRLVKKGDKLVSASSVGGSLPYTLFGYRKENLSGAQFKVYAAENIIHPDGKTGVVTATDKLAMMNVRGEKKEAVCVSDSDGNIAFENLYPGHYLVKETAAPEGFARLAEPIDVYIGTGNGEQSLTADVDDLRQEILVTVVKKVEKSGAALPGALFGLYADSDITSSDKKVLVKKGSLIEQVLTDKEGRAQFRAKLPHGKYIVKEIEAPSGYVRSGEEFAFEAVWKDSRQDTITYSHVFYNSPIVIDIIYREAEPDGNGPVVEGVKYHLEDKEGNIITIDGEKLTLISGGTARRIEKIPPGEYRIVTDEVPKGYLIPDPVDITVKDITDLQHFKVLLKKAGTEPSQGTASGAGGSPVKTLDDTPLALWIAMMVIALLSAASGFFYLRTGRRPRRPKVF